MAYCYTKYKKLRYFIHPMKSLKEALVELTGSKVYKDWKKNNKECYLSYAFYVVDKEDTNWKIGYYHSEEDKITSFDIGKKITIEPDEEVFKKEKNKVQAIKLDDVKLDLADAVSLANDVQKEEYVNENPIKIIAILQKLEGHQVWNLTFLTQNFNTLNFKIKADTGRILDKRLVSLMQLGTPMPGIPQPEQ